VHHLNARQKRFPNSNFQVNLIQEGQLVSETVDISTPPPGFQRLDLYFSYNLKNKSSLKSQIRIIAQNLTNSEYRDYLNRMRFYSADLGRNLQVQLNFKY
jgi:iron complex outermembrane receptor protein